MTYIYDVPEWTWDLVIALQKYRDEHAPLYQRGDGPNDFQRAECFDHMAAGLIPSDVWFAAEAIALDRSRRAPQTSTP